MTFLERVCDTLATAKVGFVVVGGYAVALHGACRGTLDVDIALRWSDDDVKRAVAALHDIGLVSRVPVTADDVLRSRDELIHKRRMRAWNFHNPDNIAEQVDVMIDYDAAGKAVVYKKLPDATVPVLNVGDLIEMKRASGRRQDRADIAALEKLR